MPPGPEAVAGLDAIALVEGTWGWPEGKFTCDGLPHIFSIVDGGQRLLMNAQRPDEVPGGRLHSAVHYKILRTEGARMWLFLEGEKRLTASGDPVSWVLEMVDRDTYRWRRTDWPPDRATASLKRCTRK